MPDSTPTLVRELHDVLREIVGPGRIGRPALLDYYHDTDTCEMPDSCAHCLLTRRARVALDRLPAPCAKETP